MTAHHDPDDLRAAAVTSARRAGCICRPAVELTEQGDGIWRADVQHDGWCPVVARGVAAWN
ncbi:MAG: hypothetical protein ACR2JF_06280 [Iamia sp.]